MNTFDPIRSKIGRMAGWQDGRVAEDRSKGMRVIKV